MQLKKKMQEISLWLKISFYKEKQKLESLTLIYVMTLGVSWTFNGFLEKVIQLRWFGMPFKSFPSLLEVLGIEYIIDHGSFWVNIMLNSLYAFKIVLVSKLFLQTFLKLFLISFIIILEYCSQLSKLTCSCYSRFPNTFSSTIFLLLKQCFQKGQRLESAWWLPL